MDKQHQELLAEEKSFIKKMGISNLLTIVAAIGVAITTSSVALYRLADVQQKVEKLTNERDALIEVKTQQREITQRLDKLDAKNDKIFELVLSISRH